MQSPTHLLVGVWIDRTVPDFRPGALRRLSVAVLGVTSHAALDGLANLTYHPPDPAPGDPFWLGYHAGMAALTAGIVVKNWKRHRFAMACAVLPDLDWVIINTSARLGFRTPNLRQPFVHRLLNQVLLCLPLMGWIGDLPNWRQKKTAAVLELIFIALLLRQPR